MKLSRTLIITYCLLSITLSGCSIFALLSAKTPEIKGLKKIIISEISLSEVEFTITLEVLNENSFSADVKKAQYKVFLNNEYLGSGVSEKTQTLYDNKISDLELPLKVKYKDLPSGTVALIKDILKGKKIKYKVEGDADVEAEGFSASVSIDIEKELIANKN